MISLKRSFGTLCSVAATIVLCTACNSRQPAAEADSHDSHGAEETSTPVASNRIPVPETVRKNLGIRFAKVESRRVASSLRIPGKFEALPSSRREYRTPLAGSIELLVNQYEKVTTGMPLYRLDSPQWRTLQQEYADALARVTQTSAAVVLAEATLQSGKAANRITKGRQEAGARHVQALRDALRIAEDRVAELERVRQIAGGLANELATARAEVASARTALTLAEEENAEVEQQRLQMTSSGDGAFATTQTLEATLLARKSDHEAAKTRLALARASLRSVLRVADEALDEPTSSGVPLWQSIDEIEVRAVHHGIVEKLDLASGAFAEPATMVLSTLDPDALRFRAVGLQSDMGKLQSGMPASICPPRGSSVPADQCMPGTLSQALEGDPEERTMDMIVMPEVVLPWARAGVTAFVEVELEGEDDSEPAIPESAIVQDELQKIFFRRDPDNPDQVIRMEADIGVSDGHYVSLLSGVAVGDEVVCEGAYQLKLAGSGKIPQGAHVDADGTVHFGKH